VEDSGEDGIIARYFRPLAQHPGAFGLIDDAAILTPPDGADLVLKADAIIGGVHFFPDDPPDTIARKALRVNLSDLAAKGAEPAGFLLSLALPETVTEDWLAAFSAGLKADADHYGCPLMGGDTDKTPGPAMISIAAFGLVPRGTMVRRSGAQAGDIIAVTGTIGDAALGLRLRRKPDAWALDEKMRAHLAGRYLLPEPRNVLAPAVRAYASGAMDVSDGLVGDLAKLCRASGVAAEVEISRVPLSPAARGAIAADATLLEIVLTGGDDYEILCTMPSANFAAFSEAAARTGVAVTAIGRIAVGEGARFLDDAGKSPTFARGSYSHF
jgi:thiamine-monophosphate kinase